MFFEVKTFCLHCKVVLLVGVLPVFHTYSWSKKKHRFLYQVFPPKSRTFSFNHQSSISRGRLTAGTLQITNFIQENNLPNQEAGETLTEALNTLGMAVCTGSLAASAGKAGCKWCLVPVPLATMCFLNGCFNRMIPNLYLGYVFFYQR